jgi:hypothetical protein
MVQSFIGGATMAAKHDFSGPDGMKKKIRLLASNCADATQGLSRTLLLAVSAPDPMSTPDAEYSSPRGIRIQTLDKGMRSKDIALLLGSMMGFIDQIENGFAMEFGDEFHTLVDEARDSYGHSVMMDLVPVVLMESKPWKSREGVRKS